MTSLLTRPDRPRTDAARPRPLVLIATLGGVLAAAGPLLVLLAALVYAAYWGYTNVIAPVPPPPPTPCVEQTLPKRQLATKQVYVKVFNGGNSRGLAANVGRAMRKCEPRDAH